MNGVLHKMEITDTMNIPDNRTIELLKDYEFYKYSPHLINNAVWKEAYILMSKLEPRMF